jgi:hypothetical protein
MEIIEGGLGSDLAEVNGFDAGCSETQQLIGD